MSARTPSQYSATEWLTTRPLPIFVLFAIEILAIDFFRLPEIMSFDSYAFCDNGANLTVQYLVSRGLRPAIDFGYHYGLLPILVGRIWFAIAGLTPVAYQGLIVVCDLIIVSAIARIAINLRFNTTSLALTAITLGFAVRASYPSLAQVLEATLLSCALAEQSAGKHHRALIFASAAIFAKPSMGYVYAAVLILLSCRNLRGKRSMSQALHVIAPAVVSSIAIATLLATFYGPTVLINAVLPLEGAVAYHVLHYGFFNDAGRQFWNPQGVSWLIYLVDFSGFWIVGTLFLICSGVLAISYLASDGDGTSLDPRRNEIIVTCAVLHVAFITLFFGNQWSWIYYAYFLTIGVATAAGASAVQRRVAFGLCVLGLLAWTDVAFWERRWWQTRHRYNVMAGLWASDDEREQWQTVLDMVRSHRAPILDTKGAGELLFPGFEMPVSLYLDNGLMLPADVQRKVKQISEAQMVVVPVDGIEACRGIPAAPEFATAMKSFDPRIKGKFFDVYQRPSSPSSPVSK
jgi:hypothetical protein